MSDQTDKQTKELEEKKAKELAEQQAKELAEQQAKELAEQQAKELAAKKAMTDGDMQKVTATTAQQLAKQKKEKIKLYLNPEERQKLESAVAAGKQVVWPYETVQINGHTYQIQRGKEVEVPESVADVLRQADII